MSSSNGRPNPRRSAGAQMPPLEQILKGRRLLLTGGTGFLGKVFLYILLRSHPEIGRVYLLIRGDRRSSLNRFRREILDSQVFERLREHLGSRFEHLVEEKIAILPGDISEKGLFDEKETKLKHESFDAVVNVESSHCYGSMEAFLSEVCRVLRPGGSFLYADLRDRASLAEWRTQLLNSRMNIVSETDITSNVLAALDADNDRKSALIHQLIPRPLIGCFTDFAGMRGSVIYEGFRTGGLTYRAFRLHRNV